MKVTIEMTEEQAYIVMESLELFSRIKMGQLYAVSDMLIREDWESRKNLDRTLVRFIEESLKRTLFPDLDQNAFYSIHSKQTGKHGAIAWDIYESIRCEMAHERDKKTEVYPPYHISQLPLPKVTVEDDKK